MLGPKILVAPIVKKKGTKRTVLLPPGIWTHAFTKQEYKVKNPQGLYFNIHAPLGTPLVFTTGDDSMEMAELISPSEFLATQ
jgi:alpha-glucosidase (family GH31 glycosyl hydrolase)